MTVAECYQRVNQLDTCLRLFEEWEFQEIENDSERLLATLPTLVRRCGKSHIANLDAEIIRIKQRKEP